MDNDDYKYLANKILIVEIQLQQINDKIDSILKPKKQRSLPEKSEPSPFDLKAIYNVYPARNGTQRLPAAYAHLKRSITTNDQYNLILQACQNYRDHIRLNKKEGTEFVLSFFNFVREEWTSWTNEATRPNIVPMSKEEIWNL